MREQLADICDAEIQSDSPSCYVLADAIIAALPDMVKPLEWEVDRNRIRSGEYIIFEFIDGFYLEASGVGLANPFPALEAAQAAAQAHHVAQVLSTFGITPPDAGKEG